MPAPIDTFMTNRSMQSESPYPRAGASNLTLGLMAAGASGNGMAMDSGVGGGSNNMVGSFQHSNGIPMNASRLRRESFAHRDLAGSLTNKMSWGGKSVESWVMDDLMMTGTSPFQAYQSPSFHSSSYLPKLEAQFFKDFSCCNVTLPSLHELLKHYEECHASQHMAPLGVETNMHSNVHQAPMIHHQQPNHTNHHDLVGQVSRGAGVTSPISGMHGLGMSMRQQQLAASQQRHYQHQLQQQRRPYGQREMDEDDMDGTEAAGEMDMDQDLTPPSNPQARTPRQQLRLSAPGTPSHILSSVSTPIMPHNTLELPRHQMSSLAGHPAFSPDSSVPGTPAAIDHPEFGFQHHNLLHQGYVPASAQPQQQQPVSMAAEGGMFGEMCIDEPAKRLYTPGGYGITAAQMQHLKYSMGGGVPANQNPPGRVGGVQGLPIGGVEDKPFKCPVVGCEKAYKNQNGLKYHKAHGHTNQILSENGDGTLSIVNPETSTPYPGTLGMEKEKPYKCEVCGKRYKNLNGLKYHRAHSTHGNMTPVQPTTTGIVAVAGGIAGEDSMMGLIKKEAHVC